MTITEIAERAGVSIGTVDRVIHNRGRIAPVTKQKIQKIIDDEGYQPNPLARHLRRKAKIKIGVLIPKHDSESGYWHLVWQGLQNAVSELSAFSLHLESFEFSRQSIRSLSSAFKKLEAANCAAWILAPIMQEECHKLIGTCQKKIPFICIDSPLPGFVARSTIAQDPYRGGQLAGKLMNIISSSGKTFAVIRPYTEAFNLNERFRGFLDWYSHIPNSKVLDLVLLEQNSKTMGKTLDKAFRDNPTLSGIFVASSMAHKVINYLDLKTITKKVHLIGYDLVPQNEHYLKKGKIDCLISQRPEEQGRLAIHEVYKALVLQEEGQQIINVPLDIFFKENLP